MKYIYVIFLLFNLSLFANEVEQNQLENKQPEVNEPEQKQQQDLIDINNSFITKYEYGKMLYNNPRGIGCNSCHGNDARGKKMVDFKLENFSEYNNIIVDCSTENDILKVKTQTQDNNFESLIRQMINIKPTKKKK